MKLTEFEIARDEALEESERDILSEVESLENEIEENDGRCSQCNACMINEVYCHETGCPTAGRILNLEKRLESLWDY